MIRTLPRKQHDGRVMRETAVSCKRHELNTLVVLAHEESSWVLFEIRWIFGAALGGCRVAV